MYTAEGYLWDLPEGIETFQVKKMAFRITDKNEIAKLERIFEGYRRNNPSWNAPLAYDKAGMYLKVSVSGLINKLTREAVALPLDKWAHRPARIMFKIKPYRFVGSNGIIVTGGSATLQLFEFAVY